MSILLQPEPFKRLDAEYAARYDMECPSKAVKDSYGNSHRYPGDCKILDSSLCLILHVSTYTRIPSISIQPVKVWEEYRVEAETCIQASPPGLSYLAYLFLVFLVFLVFLIFPLAIDL